MTGPDARIETIRRVLEGMAVLSMHPDAGREQLAALDSLADSLARHAQTVEALEQAKAERDEARAFVTELQGRLTRIGHSVEEYEEILERARGSERALEQAEALIREAHTDWVVGWGISGMETRLSEWLAARAALAADTDSQQAGTT